MKLTVKNTYTDNGPRYAHIENLAATHRDWDNTYVYFGGYFGPYSPYLFAAAPDMYDGIEEVILQLEYLQEKNPTGTTPAIIAKARAVLAKARGEA
jgi:hypothetical protein